MKNLSRISNALYNEKWLILPSTHKLLQKRFEQYLQNDKAQMPMADEDETEETPIYRNVANTVIISIDGAIGKRLSSIEKLCAGACDLNEVNAALKQADSDPAIQNIILDFNSPGGTVTGVSETGNLIADIATRKSVIAFSETLCASAAYWLASQCNAFYATPSATVGSVGVYLALMDATRAYEKEGLKPEVFFAGKYKVSGADFRQITDEERAIFQAEVDELHIQFKAAIGSKRSIKDEDMQGQTFDGMKALDKGFIDGNVNDMDELLSMLSIQAV